MQRTIQGFGLWVKRPGCSTRRQKGAHEARELGQRATDVGGGANRDPNGMCVPAVTLL